MPVNKWVEVIALSDLFEKMHQMPFTEFSNAVAERIRNSQWYAKCGQDSAVGSVTDNLAQSDRPISNYYWNRLCDLADADHVWLDVLG